MRQSASLPGFLIGLYSYKIGFIVLFVHQLVQTLLHVSLIYKARIDIRSDMSL